MKKWILVSVAYFAIANSNAQTLITYGNNTVDKDEFLRAYNKNKTAETNKAQSIRDYLELYTNFKLKVKVAREMRLDTSDQFKNDLENFRKQIEENYLSDASTFNALMNEVFERSQADLHLIRYSIKTEENMDPADTLAKRQAIYDLYEQAQPTENLKTKDLDPAIKRVDMGYVTVFSLPYAIENMVYKLQKGEVSKPYRTKNGWHVFQVIDIRKSAGKWKVAQILLTSPANADDQTKLRAIQLSDSLYTLLQKGADFSELARQFSDDKLTYLNGGEMQEFTTGKFEPAFENEVMSLQKDGDISKPFQTSFGIHIVKRLSVTPTPTDKQDEGFQFELKQKLMQDERVKIAKDKFAKEVIAKIGFKQTFIVSNNDIIRYADSVMQDPAGFDVSKTPISTKRILSISRGSINGKEWLTYVRDYVVNPENYKGETAAELWERYQPQMAMDYYRKNLERFNSDFAFQLQEFREGNLLFDVMEKKVWSGASSDSSGLQQYYVANKDKYLWDASADVLMINAVSEEDAKEALSSIRNGKNWRQVAEDKQGSIQADSSRFELAQLVSNANPSPGTFSDINKNGDGTYGFVYYYRLYPAGQQRSFEDSKGMVINDYQQVVERKWIESLRKQYPVKVDEALLKKIISNLQ
jgi:peptidyl-prolyl cis-trans isomerase SurA